MPNYKTADCSALPQTCSQTVAFTLFWYIRLKLQDCRWAPLCPAIRQMQQKPKAGECSGGQGGLERRLEFSQTFFRSFSLFYFFNQSTAGALACWSLQCLSSQLQTVCSSKPVAWRSSSEGWYSRTVNKISHLFSWRQDKICRVLFSFFYKPHKRFRLVRNVLYYFMSRVEPYIKSPR